MDDLFNVASNAIVEKSVDIKQFHKAAGFFETKQCWSSGKKSTAFSRQDIERFLVEANDLEFLHVK